MRSQNVLFEIATTLFGVVFFIGGIDMLKMLFPLIVIVISNCAYNICTKSIPEEANTFGALMVAYLVGAVISGVLFVVVVKPANVCEELSKVDRTSVYLGAALVGLEAGYILLYRVGWKISTGALTANTCLAVALLLIGYLLYNEQITFRQVMGMAVCAAGLLLIKE